MWTQFKSPFVIKTNSIFLVTMSRVGRIHSSTFSNISIRSIDIYVVIQYNRLSLTQCLRLRRWVFGVFTIFPTYSVPTEFEITQVNFANSGLIIFWLKVANRHLVQWKSQDLHTSFCLINSVEISRASFTIDNGSVEISASCRPFKRSKKKTN